MSTHLRVRFLLPDAYRVGGTVRSVFNLAGVLAARHDVEIASATRSSERPALDPPAGVRLLPLENSRAVTGYVRTAHDGVLIGTRPELNVTLARFARPGVVAVGQEHFHLGHHSAEQRAGMQRWYPRLDAHVSLTECDAEAYRQLLGPFAEVRRIPNGIGDPGVPPSQTVAPLAVAAGRLARQKGYDRLLRAWPKVLAVQPDWRLRIFGEGPHRGRLEAMIERLGIAASVELAGFTDRLPAELAKGSFFVLSSRFEGLPMVLLEAMSCGLPAVSFDCPTGPRELVTPGVDGLLVPPDDVPALASAMVEMIELGARRAQLGAAALATSLRYRVPAIAAQWEALFDELAPSGGARRALRGRATQGLRRARRRALGQTPTAASQAAHGR